MNTRPKLDFGKMLPPVNFAFNIGPTIWLVTYINQGKKTISCRIIGVKIGHDKVIMPDGTEYSIDAFDKMRRQCWPLAHEQGRNPQNVSLSINNGSMPGSAAYAQEKKTG